MQKKIFLMNSQVKTTRDAPKLWASFYLLMMITR